jgi:glycosyltransferase involved in cell wall biosynthesis
MVKKLVVQIPCFNEAETIGETIGNIPREIPGIEEVVILIIDDGSHDETAKVALENGADYVVRHRSNRGLSSAFMTGIQTSLELGADIIVNTDADNQYPGIYIVDLIKPILQGKADLVIGDRQPRQNEHFSPLKQRLEALGSWAIRIVSEVNTPDAPSGFRAYSRFAALRIQVYNQYSYTLETLIQAGKERMLVEHIAIKTNPAKRPSRLHKGILNFIWRQSGVILRSYILYRPLRTFTLLAIPFMIAGVFLLARFLFFFVIGDSGVGRYVQSVSIGGTLFTFGFLLLAIGLLGDALRANRQILQEILARSRNQSHQVQTDDEPDFEVLGMPIIRDHSDKKRRKKSS